MSLFNTNEGGFYSQAGVEINVLPGSTTCVCRRNSLPISNGYLKPLRSIKLTLVSLYTPPRHSPNCMTGRNCVSPKCRFIAAMRNTFFSNSIVLPFTSVTLKWTHRCPSRSRKILQLLQFRELVFAPVSIFDFISRSPGIIRASSSQPTRSAALAGQLEISQKQQVANKIIISFI